MEQLAADCILAINQKSGPLFTDLVDVQITAANTGITEVVWEQRTSIIFWEQLEKLIERNAEYS